MKSFIVFKSIGIDNDLQFWAGVIQNISKQFNSCYLFSETNHSSQNLFEFKKLSPKLLSFINYESIIRNIYRERPAVVFINEFSIYSLQVIISSFFIRTFKICLLVENDPIFLKGYGIKKTSIPSQLLRLFISRFSHVILTNNQHGEDYLTHSLRVNKNKIVTSPYLVSSMQLSNPFNNNDNNSKLKFLFVGQLIKRKGVHLLVQEISLLGNEYLNKFELHIVGKGEYENEIRKFISPSMQDNVIFHGSTPYADIQLYYKSADIFVWPTLADYRALVGFEAISSGLPVIFSILDGSASEVVEQDKNGFLINPLEKGQIAEKMRWFINNSESIKSMSLYSFNKSKNYTLEVSENSFRKVMLKLKQ